jgi:hypothetical protein
MKTLLCSMLLLGWSGSCFAADFGLQGMGVAGLAQINLAPMPEPGTPKAGQFKSAEGSRVYGEDGFASRAAARETYLEMLQYVRDAGIDAADAGDGVYSYQDGDSARFGYKLTYKGEEFKRFEVTMFKLDTFYGSSLDEGVKNTKALLESLGSKVGAVVETDDFVRIIYLHFVSRPDLAEKAVDSVRSEKAARAWLDARTAELKKDGKRIAFSSYAKNSDGTWTAAVVYAPASAQK